MQRILAVLASALWRLRDPACAYHTSSAAEGEKKEWGEKSNLVNLKLHSPTTEDSSSLCELSLFSAFPSALFSIRKALFLNLLGPRRTTLEKKTKRWNLPSFPPCHIFNLPNTHMHRHPHCCHHAVLPCVAFSFSLLKLLLFLVIPGDTLDELERALVERFNLIFRCQA